MSYLLVRVVNVLKSEKRNSRIGNEYLGLTIIRHLIVSSILTVSCGGAEPAPSSGVCHEVLPFFRLTTGNMITIEYRVDALACEPFIEHTQGKIIPDLHADLASIIAIELSLGAHPVAPQRPFSTPLGDIRPIRATFVVPSLQPPLPSQVTLSFKSEN